MAPTTHDAVEEASGSRSRAERRRHRHEPAVTDHLSGAIQPEAEPSSQQGKRKAALEQSEGEGRKKKRKRTQKSHRKKAAASASTGAHASDSEASSTVSPPLRFPRMPNPDDFGGRGAPGYHAANDVYFDLVGKYHEKMKRQCELVTLDTSIPFSSLVTEGQLRSVRESATKAVLQVAKVILSLSSYIDGKLMARSSGFLIGWDAKSREGTVLTSAHIICSKYTSQWSGTDEYSPNAKVVAHLLDQDETTVPAQLLHYDKHINMALFTVGIESCAKIPEFNSDVKYGQETFVMGRDENLNLTVDYEFVGFHGPNLHERPHYMFTGGAIRKSSIGGPVIDFSGEVLGMANFPGSAFIPSSIISRCLAMWKKYQCIPRLHFGMKFSPIKFLDPIHVERIFRKCNVDSGLIVEEVSNGSVAEELGVRRGDIIYSVNGKCIATTVELESLNMSICENHLDQGGTIGSWIDIPVGILHMRKGHKGPSRTLSLRLNVSDGIEVFASLLTPFD
ncbi:unnamed protein product [Miscanthus lutarioriparius]|uniref:PDZ domain-containing protein n=1 Tax=Miscanthus lutarioriparius TaxID=422564 RepID=A0A811RSW6_9POAL|nr:unnamed protein product [Miscanthus lutarioriparius]